MYKASVRTCLCRDVDLFKTAKIVCFYLLAGVTSTWWLDSSFWRSSGYVSPQSEGCVSHVALECLGIPEEKAEMFFVEQRKFWNSGNCFFFESRTIIYTYTMQRALSQLSQHTYTMTLKCYPCTAVREQMWTCRNLFINAGISYRSSLPPERFARLVLPLCTINQREENTHTIKEQKWWSC